MTVVLYVPTVVYDFYCAQFDDIASFFACQNVNVLLSITFFIFAVFDV